MTTQTLTMFPAPAAVGGVTITCETCGWKISGIAPERGPKIMGQHTCSPVRLIARTAPIVKGW